MRANDRNRTRMLAGAAAAGLFVLGTAGAAAAEASATPAPSATNTTSASRPPDAGEPPTSAPSPEPPTTESPAPVPPTSSGPAPSTPPTSSGPAPSTPPTTSDGGTAQGSSLTVSPNTAHPGQHVVVRLSCLGDRGAVRSTALRLGGRDAAAGSVYTDATVSDTAAPGPHTVTATCAGKPLTATFTVAGASGGSPTAAPQPAQVRVVPEGAVETGDGSLASNG